MFSTVPISTDKEARATDSYGSLGIAFDDSDVWQECQTRGNARREIERLKEFSKLRIKDASEEPELEYLKQIDSTH